jgi:hypothetical protein
LSVDLPVRLTVKDSTLTARCKEISNQAMRLELSHTLPPNSYGIVSMIHADGSLELNVRVAHVSAKTVGVEFIYGSDQERDAVSRLVARLGTAQNRSCPVLLK